MPPTAPSESFSLTESLRQEIIEGGPISLLLHLLFVANVILALVVLVRGQALPWMLLVSCGPFIWASSAAHTSFFYHLAIFDHNAPAATQAAPFIYAMNLFNLGVFLSVALMGFAFFRHFEIQRRTRRSSA